MITHEDFTKAKEILWNNEYGPKVTTDPEVSELLREAMSAIGITVTRVGRKPKSPNKFILFTIAVHRVEGMDTKFLTPGDAQAWQSAKSQSLSTLMKAPDSAFEPVKTTEEEEMIWWNQAYSLAYRKGADISEVTRRILLFRGSIAGEKYGI